MTGVKVWMKNNKPSTCQTKADRTLNSAIPIPLPQFSSLSSSIYLIVKCHILFNEKKEKPLALIELIGY